MWLSKPYDDWISGHPWHDGDLHKQHRFTYITYVNFDAESVGIVCFLFCWVRLDFVGILAEHWIIRISTVPLAGNMRHATVQSLALKAVETTCGQVFFGVAEWQRETDQIKSGYPKSSELFDHFSIETYGFEVPISGNLQIDHERMQLKGTHKSRDTYLINGHW
jgi:hypothetical protein